MDYETLKNDILRSVHEGIVLLALARTDGMDAEQVRERLGAIRDMVRLEARALELLKGDADGPDTDRAAIDLINELERLAPAVADAIDDNAPLVD